MNLNGMNAYSSMSPEVINAVFKAMEVGPRVLLAIAVVALIVILAERILIGVLCKRFAKKKGYKGYFFTGFILGWIGFVYVIFLPDLKMQKYVEMAAMRLQDMDARIARMEEKNSEAA